MLKKLCFEMSEYRNQIEHRTGFLQFYVKTKKVCRCFASFSSEQAHFTHGMYVKALILPSDVKKIEPIMFYEGTVPKILGAKRLRHRGSCNVTLVPWSIQCSCMQARREMCVIL